MKSHIGVIAILTLFAMLAGCASGGQPDNLVTGTLAPPDSALATLQSEELQISPQDKLSVSVFGVPELGGEYPVDQYGMVKMPLIGEVHAMGHTQHEFARILETELEESYLQNADVTVSISSSIDQMFTVEGAVNSPGQYTVADRMSLLQAVAVAGGPTKESNPKKVLVFREIGGQRMAAIFDLTAIRSGKAEDPVVYGNDTIVVDGSTVAAQYANVLRTLSTLAIFIAL